MKKNYSDWLINKYGGNSAKEAITNIVEKLLMESNNNDLPIKLSEIAKLIGINPIPIYQDQISLGQLIEINSEFRISLKMKSRKPPKVNWSGYPRLRFSYAHELIHCLHYDFSCSPPRRIAPESVDIEEENLSNFGASLLIFPKKIVKEFIETLDSDDIIHVTNQLSKKNQTSFHASILYLVNSNFLQNSKNKIFILSSISKGYRGRGAEKPRCLVSKQYLNNHEMRHFIPGYKGIDVISESWSLMNCFKKSISASEIFVENEIIDYKGIEYLINGKHKFLDKGYIWSTLDFDLV
ncbi:ImmA/IrrE family metallo-endopeptidase [Bacteroidota bacterium]